MPNANGLNIPQLLSEARGGNRQALDELFRACRAYLSLIAQAHLEGRLRAKVDASDLIQQTLLEAYRDFEHFHGSTEPEWLAWLRQTLANNAGDVNRQFLGTAKRQAAREVALDGLAPCSSVRGDVPAPGETPSRQLMRQERELEIAEALSRLPAEYQEVIRLRNLLRLPFDEVAVRLGRSRPAAQMLWMRALHKLQGMIRNDL